MNAKTQVAVEAHGAALVKFFGMEAIWRANCKDPATINTVLLCKRLRRLERMAQAWALAVCNGELEPTEAESDTKHEWVENRLADLLGESSRGKTFFNTDPRGYALKIKSEFAQDFPHRDWGGYGIIAPDLTEGGR